MSEPTIIFYGENFTPLSNECYGCHHYNYICNGSVNEGECRAGVVKNIIPSILAGLIWQHSENRFILARCFGYDIQKEVNKEDFKSEELIQEFHQAITTPEETIHLYKKMFSIDIHGVVNIKENVEEELFEETTLSFKDNLLDDMVNVIDITEDNLPF